MRTSFARDSRFTLRSRRASSWSRKLQAVAREELCLIPYADSRAEAEQRRDRFAKKWRRADPNAVAILEKGRERTVAFYQSSQAHWKHLRATNIVESPSAAVRLRTDPAKRFKKVANVTAMTWRLPTVAEKRFRRIDAPELAAHIYRGVKFEDGEEGHTVPAEGRLRPLTHFLT